MLRGKKNPPQQKNMPHFHLMLSIFSLSFKVSDERLFSMFSCSALKSTLSNFRNEEFWHPELYLCGLIT